MSETAPVRRLKIEGYVIASADGMLADAQGVMPKSLKFRGDQAFLFAGLGLADLIIHGRHSIEEDEGAKRRRRIVVTRSVGSLAGDLDNPRVTWWNPKGATFDEACAMSGVTQGTAAVLGGPDVFALFFDRFDTFFLSQAPKVTLPGGRGCFPGVPEKTPQAILAAHGLVAGPARVLDAKHEVQVTPWMRGVRT